MIRSLEELDVASWIYWSDVDDLIAIGGEDDEMLRSNVENLADQPLRAASIAEVLRRASL